MRISICLLFSLLVILPYVYGQAENAESLQGDNGISKDGELDAKNDESVSGDNENKENKPRKTMYSDERFEKLFNNNRLRKARLPTPKHHVKAKPVLPSFIKKPPSVKPLGPDGQPIDDTPPRATTPSSRARTVSRNVSKVSTTTPSSRGRSRTSTSTTTQKPSISDSSRRFNSARGRISNNSLTPGRGRLN